MSLKARISRLREHPLSLVLAGNKGNPRTLVLIEPLWGIPYNLIAPFATLYMVHPGHHGCTNRLDPLHHYGRPGIFLLLWRYSH